MAVVKSDKRHCRKSKYYSAVDVLAIESTTKLLSLHSSKHYCHLLLRPRPAVATPTHLVKQNSPGAVMLLVSVRAYGDKLSRYCRTVECTGSTIPNRSSSLGNKRGIWITAPLPTPTQLGTNRPRLRRRGAEIGPQLNLSVYSQSSPILLVDREGEAHAIITRELKRDFAGFLVEPVQASQATS